MRTKRYNIEDVRIAIRDNYSIAGVLRQLGLKPLGGNYRTINRLIVENEIDTSHFTGQGWNVGLAFKPNKGITDEYLFSENSPYKCSWRLRERYKKATGIYCCENCGLIEWMGQKISLEIHHLNGNHKDNRLENLRLLCPNCHALTSNYRGKNRLPGHFG